MKRILVLSPHPDDEAIGCGGTLRKHVLEGDRVLAIFLTSGERGGHGRPIEETRRVREAEARKAARILGLAEIEFWGEQDGALRATRALIERLRRAIRRWQPNTLYLPHRGEMHPDHRASVRLAQRALTGRGAPDKDLLNVLMFEIWTPLQQMDEIVEITPYLKTKLAAVRAYQSQCSVVGFDEAVAGLNRYRGEMHSWPEGQYAEVFARLPL